MACYESRYTLWSDDVAHDHQGERMLPIVFALIPTIVGTGEWEYGWLCSIGRFFNPNVYSYAYRAQQFGEERRVVVR